MSSITTRFKNARIKTEFSQSDIALKIGISLRIYQRVEANPEKLSIIDLKKYATLFVVTLSSILDESPPKTQTNLSDAEQELLNAYKTLSDGKKKMYYLKILGDAQEIIEEQKDLKRKQHSNNPLNPAKQVDSIA